jgi:hypothetical protein
MREALKKEVDMDSSFYCFWYLASIPSYSFFHNARTLDLQRKAHIITGEVKNGEETLLAK